ncbi:MAG: UDP-3-O-(3-hydroxymyristoyl)glucosamine N-acyltransferase [Acidobacteriota bacterium]
MHGEDPGGDCHSRGRHPARRSGAAHQRHRALPAASRSDLSFLAGRRYRAAARESQAGGILVGKGESLPGKDVIEVQDPYLALARALNLFLPPPPPPAGIHPKAVIGEGCIIGQDPEIGAGAVRGAAVRLGARVRIGAQTVLAQGVEVGSDSVLHPQVCCYKGVRIGCRVIIHAGTVLGADGFGYATGRRMPVKIPQIGGVLVEDEVEIGAGVCVDRGTLGETVIGRGVKIDNLVQIAHNVRIGAGSLLAAQAGISGSTRLGAAVQMAGQSGIVGHVLVGEGVRVAAKSAVTRSIEPGLTVAGIPAVEIGRWRRAAAAFPRLPQMMKRLARLERRAPEAGGNLDAGRRETAHE